MSTSVSTDINDLAGRTNMSNSEFARLLGCDESRLDSLRTGISAVNATESARLSELASLLDSNGYKGLPSAFVYRRLMTIRDAKGSDFDRLESIVS